jgi:cytochrome P450 family 714 subfamily C
MVDVVIDRAYALTEDWSKLIENGGGKAEIMVQNYLASFSGNIISRVCFGDSYGKGDMVLSKLSELQAAGSKSSFINAIPGARYVIV